jgi:molybdopterin-containing oxidoreductase family membrane subunit
MPVIAVAEIKYVLKISGESYKDDMASIENKDAEQFGHEMAHTH